MKHDGPIMSLASSFSICLGQLQKEGLLHRHYNLTTLIIICNFILYKIQRSGHHEVDDVHWTFRYYYYTFSVTAFIYLHHAATCDLFNSIN